MFSFLRKIHVLYIQAPNKEELADSLFCVNGNDMRGAGVSSQYALCTAHVRSAGVCSQYVLCTAHVRGAGVCSQYVLCTAHVRGAGVCSQYGLCTAHVRGAGVCSQYALCTAHVRVHRVYLYNVTKICSGNNNINFISDFCLTDHIISCM